MVKTFNIIKLSLLSALVLLTSFNYSGGLEFLELTNEQKHCLSLKEKYPHINCFDLDKTREDVIYMQRENSHHENQEEGKFDNLQNVTEVKQISKKTVKEEITDDSSKGLYKIKSLSKLNLNVSDDKSLSSEEFMKKMGSLH